jgi:hypothetical protein
MGLVNPPQVTPPVMRAICRYFAYRGPDHTVSRAELEGVLEPPSATNPGQARPRPVEATISEAVALGILASDGSGDDETLRCAIELPSVPLERDVHDRELAAVLRRVALESANTDDLFAGKDALDTTKAREFARIAAWLLMQDPTGAGLAWGVAERYPEEDVERRQSAQANMSLVVNGDRWNSFRRWSRYFGLSRLNLDGRLIPDPLVAIADELPSVFDSERDLAVDTFVARVAERLPVLDEGQCQRAVLTEAMKSDPRDEITGDRPLSRAAAFALHRLERRGGLQLHNRADAPAHRNIGERVVTHVSLPEAA